MQGQGFTALKKVNDRVRRGEPIIRFDRERLSAYDLTVMMFVTQPQALHWQKHLENSRVEAGDRVMTGDVYKRQKLGSVRIIRSVCITAEEAQIFRDIAAKGVRITAQTVPSDECADFIPLINRAF